MSKTTRRSFLKTSLVGTMSVLAPYAKVLGANNDIRIAVIGFNSKGKQHIDVFRELKGVRVTAICDIDPRILSKEVNNFKKRNESVFATTDAREIMDRKDVDAVVIASANHWHALQAIWACQAGKDVYVEKPVSHNIWEGQQMVAAARKYGRIVQAGTQTRSDEGFQRVIKYIHSGQLGEIKQVNSIMYRYREGIGKRKPYYPAWFDYDYWCGPAEKRPLERERFHYDWHWKWDTGNGDSGNIGIHQVDISRAIAGYDTLPPSVISLGGRFGFNDAGDTANTQMTVLNYPKVPIIIENRNLPRRKGLDSMDHFMGTNEGHVIQCEEGYYVGSYGGGWAYDKKGKKLKQFAGDGGGKHQQNFIDAMRNKNVKLLNADINEGHLSTSCCHLGNVSYRVGETADVATCRDALQGNEISLDALSRLEKHLAANKINLEKTPLQLGSWIHVDQKFQTIKKVDNGNLEMARTICKPKYRKPFTIPALL